MPDSDVIPMCRQCGYSLDGLLGEPGTCPECGRGFDPLDPNSYYIRPPFLAWRFWLPALLLAVGLGLVSILVGKVLVGVWGYSVWIGVPSMVGCILAYRLRSAHVAFWMSIVGGIIGLTLGLVTAGFAGIFCSIVLPAILFLPMMLGVALGAGLRHSLKNSAFNQRHYLPIIALFAASIGWHVIERRFAGPSALESISTVAIISSDADTCYRCLVFYEEVKHEPPLIMQFALPRPLKTTGAASKVGDIKVCLYTGGQLTKQITEAAPGKRLAFNVIDQKIGLEHDVRLHGGSFEFQPIDAAHTRVTLTTTYTPFLAPRFAWRWAERYAVHTLHEHVLEGIRLRAQEASVPGGTPGMVLP